ncbi:MAG: D-alanyl-D-alanine carboxypeptidase [Firmicutes bacterium]|nr:D-alanyl-D-alanine carboxypeptidase [Bacillota bacterium]
MKRLIFLIILIVFLSTNFCFADTPSINGQSGVLMERDSGRILYSHNINKKLPMASTTKIMTALLALEKGNLADEVKISSKSVGIEGSSIYLYNGEIIKLEDLIYGLMLRSGNDAAVAIANHISGSVEEFANLMNKRAKEIGAINTNFTNPHGLHNSNHYTTAYDLALITRVALKNRKFREIVSENLWVSKRNQNQYFFNKNKTISQYKYGDGVKIGYTTKAGRCLVASATKDKMQLIAVVLNDYSWFNDCYRLFDYGFNNYDSLVVYDNKQFIKNVTVLNGKKSKIPIVTESNLILPVTEKEKNKIKIFIDAPKEIKAPINKGQKIGKVKVYLEGELITTSDLLANKDVKEKQFLDKVIGYVLNIFN